MTRSWALIALANLSLRAASYEGEAYCAVPRTGEHAARVGIQTCRRTMPSTGPESTSQLQSAMQRLTAAIKAKSSAQLLECFSKNVRWTLASQGTGNANLGKRKYTYAQLRKGLRPDGDFYELFFSDDSELNRYIDQDPGWILVDGTVFVPHEYAKVPLKSAPTFVQWRREGDRYVVDTLLDAGA